jgi:hypothetical protein
VPRLKNLTCIQYSFCRHLQRNFLFYVWLSTVRDRRLPCQPYRANLTTQWYFILFMVLSSSSTTILVSIIITRWRCTLLKRANGCCVQNVGLARSTINGTFDTHLQFDNSPNVLDIRAVQNIKCIDSYPCSCLYLSVLFIHGTSPGDYSVNQPVRIW